MVTHQLQVRCRPVKVRRSETDVLLLPLSYTANLPTWWYPGWKVPPDYYNIVNRHNNIFFRFLQKVAVFELSIRLAGDQWRGRTDWRLERPPRVYAYHFRYLVGVEKRAECSTHDPLQFKHCVAFSFSSLSHLLRSTQKTTRSQIILYFIFYYIIFSILLYFVIMSTFWWIKADHYLTATLSGPISRSV